MSAAAPRELKPCGTKAAYERHRRRGERACELCMERMREKWDAKWYAQQEGRTA